MPKKFYLTTPIYYVNSRPHIGHAYTTLVADVLARFYRTELGESKVYFLTGTDEHGAKVAEAAKKQNLKPEEFVAKISQEFKDTWANLNISYNDFIRTTEERHVSIVVDILKQLKGAKTPLGNDVLYEGDYEGLYCVGCEKFILPSELVDGQCPDHGQVPQKLTEKNWFFRLQDYLPQLKQAIESGEMLVCPLSRRNEVLGLIDKQNLPDFSISRSKKVVGWGIDLSWDDTQKVYVWVDALSNYITALGYPDGDLYKTFWPADVQFMALDILKFHTLYWPAILIALDAPLPKSMQIHGFFTIDGKKMSKTLGNVVDPNELIKKYGADAARYLLLSQFPFGSESDIKIEDWPIKYNADLVNGLGNLVNRVTNMVEKYLNGQIGIKKFKAIALGREETRQLRFREALLTIWQIIQKDNSLIDQAKPWELAKIGDNKKLAKILKELVADLYSIAVALQPFMPQFSEQLIKVLTAPKIIKPQEPLFPRLNN
jgi:methionyl-tRNA synthetase